MLTSTKKITSHQSEEIGKERGCGLIKDIEVSGTWVSQNIRDMLLNNVPAIPGKQVDIHFQLKTRTHLQGSKLNG